MEQISITVTGTSPAALKAQWAALWTEEKTENWTCKEDAPTTTKKTAGRPKKETVTTAAAEPEEADDLDIEGETDENKTLTLEGDVLPAFQKYAQKNSKDAARAILKKFKVNAVRELPASQWEKALAMLG